MERGRLQIQSVLKKEKELEREKHSKDFDHGYGSALYCETRSRGGDTLKSDGQQSEHGQSSNLENRVDVIFAPPLNVISIHGGGLFHVQLSGAQESYEKVIGAPLRAMITPGQNDAFEFFQGLELRLGDIILRFGRVRHAAGLQTALNFLP